MLFICSPFSPVWAEDTKQTLSVVYENDQFAHQDHGYTDGVRVAWLSSEEGGTLGTVHTNASLGTMFRLGYDLPADYGPPRIRPSMPGSDFFIPAKKLSAYLFSSVEGRVVARNIFLDGNTFPSSPHVGKELLVADIQVGGAVAYHAMRVSYTHVFMTKEFKTQAKAAQFGGISVSYRF